MTLRILHRRTPAASEKILTKIETTSPGASSGVPISDSTLKPKSSRPRPAGRRLDLEGGDVTIASCSANHFPAPGSGGPIGGSTLKAKPSAPTIASSSARFWKYR